MAVTQRKAKLSKLQAEKIKKLEDEFACTIVALEQVSQLAKLTPEQYSRVQSIENEIGVSLVAYEPASRIQLAKLSPRQVSQMKEMEKSFGYMLKAYETVYSDPSQKSLQEVPQAALTNAQHARLQELEDESELVLMAYRK